MGTVRRDLRTSGDLVMAPRVPHGLAAAVEGLTREVIRQRPEDIYVFAAQHFEELLKLRDEYGAVTNLPGKSTNTAALREMNQSLKKRSGGTEKSIVKPAKERGGWSMNETARVLERHRSIFGDKGKKVSPDEVRALGNEKENKSRRKDELEKFAHSSNQRRRGSNERFVRRKISPKDSDLPETKSKSDSNGNPKIISQIPTVNQSTGLLAKDIKSELRKNRNSSKDGRSVRAERKISERTEGLEIGTKQSGATRKTMTRSSHERSLDKLMDVGNEANNVYAYKIGTDNQKQKTDSSGWSRSFTKMPRTLSMDRVREFVIEKFRASESLEELRSTNYVDRVQEVIDEASPSILRRVKELSTRSAGRSRGYESVDESTSTSTRSDKSNQTDDIRSRSAMSVSRRSRRSSRRSKSKSKSKISGADSLEGIETLASETEQIKENRNEIETGKLKKGVLKSVANGLSGESDASDYTDVPRKASASSSISLPAVRPPSSKNPSRSVSRSDSDNLVLPPIPPDAPRSAKHREALVLPSLQIPREVIRDVESPGGDIALIGSNAEIELILPDAPTEEIFKDSLNVTPEVAASPRPDSLDSDSGEAGNDEIEDNIAELKSKLNEIDSIVKETEVTDGMKERLREIEETEKRIEKILNIESQENPKEDLDLSVKEKLIEIQEAEKRLRDILDPGTNAEETRDLDVEEIRKDESDPGIKEKLMGIEETEKRIENILDPDTQSIQKDRNDPGIEEKLMEIEETENRIEKILHPESQETHKNDIEGGMKKKLIEIEETEKRIEKILDPESQGTQKDAKDVKMKEKLIEIEETDKKIENILHSEAQKIQKDEIEGGMKEKLMEIEETEKRIEKIFNSEVPQAQNEETDSSFVKDKLIEIEEAEKRLKNIFNSTSGKEEIHKHENNSAPKTPFIPEIPSEYVTTANQEETIEEATTENPFSEQSFTPEDENKESADSNDTKAQGTNSKIEQFPSGTPDSLGNSYVLTEGSPYEIPDSVTTVIIPERRMDTPSSDILEIVLEDDLGGGSTSFHVVPTKTQEESPEGESGEISLRNILDNFGEIVHQESIAGSPNVDVDFIKNLKTSNDVVIPRKDLAFITEEDDKDYTETDILEVVEQSVTPTLHDIAETEEVLELEEAQNSSSTKSNDSENRNQESRSENLNVEGKRASEVRETESAETLKLDEKSEEVENSENENSFSPDDKNRESIEDHQSSGDRKTRSLETIEPEVIFSTTSAIGLFQQNVTDSATTESTDEVKETTISDDGGNTAAESSVTSPSCREEMGARNSESSNEVKETTISDQPADGIGKNLFSVVPQCHGSMPHVPELNLDSLQDITVSSFQLSDDATAEEEEEEDEENSGAGQPYSENDASVITATDEAQRSQNHKPVHEEIVVQERIVIEEDPCTKVTAYVTEPNTEELDPESSSIIIKENASILVSEEMRLSEHEKITEQIEIKETLDITEGRAEIKPEGKTEEVYEEVDQDKAEDTSKKEPKDVKVHEEIVEHVAEIGAEKKSEEIFRNVAIKVAEEESKDVRYDVTENVQKKVVQEELKVVQEEATEPTAKQVLQDEDKDVREYVAQEIIKKVSEKEPEELIIEISEKSSEVGIQEVHEEGVATDVANEKPKSLHEGVQKKLHEDESTEVREEVAETVTEKLHKEISNEEPEKLVKEQMEDISKKSPGDKPATFSGKIYEDVVEEVIDLQSKKVPENVHDGIFKDTIKNELEEKSEKESDEESDELISKLLISELETVSLNDFKALEAIVKEKYPEELVSGDIEAEKKNVESNFSGKFSTPEIVSNSVMRVQPEVDMLKDQKETIDQTTSGKTDIPVTSNLDPPKAEIVTNDLDYDDGNHGERTEYHIYVPEVTASEEYSTTESSTFNSAATKIQAGVRGFLTRRRLQSAQRRSSTLDSVPSIQDSIATDGTHLEPIEEVGLAQAATTIQSSYRGYRARQRLRREDAVQKTTMSVENPFSGNGLQHTGEFHDCLPLPPMLYDEKNLTARGHVDRDVENSAAGISEEKDESDTNGSQENRGWMTESTTMKDESADDDDSTFGLIVKKYPYAHQGLNLVLLSGNDAVMQSQYLNFITSIEEVHNEADSLIPGPHPSKIIDGFSTMKSNAGIESLPMDNPDTDVSVQGSSISTREPLAVPGSPTGLVIEELSKTDEESALGEVTSAVSLAIDVKSGTNLENDVVSEVPDNSLDLPGLSLKEAGKDGVPVTSGNREWDGFEIGKSVDVIDETPAPDVPQDASLGTMSFSMNVDDMLGLGAESDPPSKMKPILEVTVTPRDLLKLTNRFQGSQASGDRVESPVTMMQIVPKSVEDKSDRSEDEKETDTRGTEKMVEAGVHDATKEEEGGHLKSGIHKDNDQGKLDNAVVMSSPSVDKVSTTLINEDDESSDGTSKTFSIEKN